MARVSLEYGVRIGPALVSPRWVLVKDVDVVLKQEIESCSICTHVVAVMRAQLMSSFNLNHILRTCLPTYQPIE
jgi:hypothetical protein